MKRTEITNEHIEQVTEAYKRLWSIRAVQRELWEALNLNFHNIRYIVNELIGDIKKQKDELKDLNNAVKKQKTYEVIDDYYIFYLNEKDEFWNKETKPYPIPISTVDAMFKAYSKHWENKTSEQVLQEFKIKPEVWHVLKSRLRLFKDSHILSPVSLERFEWREEEMDDFIANAVEENIRDKYINKFQEVYEREFKKEAQKCMKKMAEIDSFLEYIREFIQDHEPKRIEFEPEAPKNNRSVDFAISDLHIGKVWTDKILERLNKIYSDISQRKEGVINIFCLWDLAEMLVEGWRHPWQIESMDWPYWFDLFMQTVEIIENFLLNIYQQWKQVKFIWITWNHWTLSDKKSGDREFTGELLIYEIIKRGLQKTAIEIEYLRWTWHSYPTDNFHYIINHWTWNQTNKKASEILWEYWDNTRENILLQWDKHHLEMNNVSDNATRVLVPALAWPWEYDTELWITSHPWYIKIEKNSDDLPDITVKNLK